MSNRGFDGQHRRIMIVSNPRSCRRSPLLSAGRRISRPPGRHYRGGYMRQASDFTTLAARLVRDGRTIYSATKTIYGLISEQLSILGNPYENEKGRCAQWPPLDHLVPYERLVPFDMSATIAGLNLRNAPIDITVFLKELGWRPSNFQGFEETNTNSIIRDLVRPIKDKIDGLDEWQVTSSKPGETYQLVRSKIDKAPKEHHKHHERLYDTYRAIADHLRERGTRIRKLTHDEVLKVINKKSSLGNQERDLKYATIGDYMIDSEVCKSRVANFRQSLRDGRPINAYYNTSPKREKKTKKTGRLFWFLGGTARIHEAMVFADADKLLSELDYTVFKMQPCRFGDELGKLMRGNKMAVCDDVSGFDTKISYSILCMEADFLRRMTDDAEHKRDIWDLYRLYAYPVVCIKRVWRGKTQEAFYQLRGQRASGNRVTYLMNTITNIVVTMCRAAISQGVHVDDMYQWTRDRLKEGHSDKYGGKISGDDSVIVLGERETELYANEVSFINEIGMLRKGFEGRETQRSDICRSMDAISFCSHNYAKVKLSNQYYRWMPVRSITEIIAKICIRLEQSKTDGMDDTTWARNQGYDLLRKYPHLPTIRLLALAILSATPSKTKVIDKSSNGKEILLNESDIKKLLAPATMTNAVGEKYDPLGFRDPSIHMAWEKELCNRLIGKHRSGRVQYTDWLNDIEKPSFFNFKSIKELLMDNLPFFNR